MQRRFHLCASLLLIMTWLWRFTTSGTVAGGDSAVLTAIQSLDDPESRLSRGEKLRLDCADIVELELLHGVSDTTASHILAAKPLLRRSQQPPHSALQAVHGIGVKKAHELARYLDLSTTCSISEGSSSRAPRTPPADPPYHAGAGPLKE